jgi:dTDP-4-amino-4,6-dideoxygalactose transaminase
MSPEGDPLPIIRPTLPALREVVELLAPSWASGVVTTGAVVRAFEEDVERITGARHAVAVSSCTAGLMLIPQALGLARGAEVVCPSFTFAATAQALVWNGLVPVFCDCVPGTLTLDPDDVARSVSSRTAAICAVYTYGLPPDVDALLELGERHGLPVYFDSAQGFGAVYRGLLAGAFGACEVFSLSPTKVVSAVEGGVVTTNDAAVAARLRSMRDYGKDPARGEDMVYLGLSARMPESSAAVARLSLAQMDLLIKARLDRITAYRERLGALPGCSVQAFPPDRRSSGNYFVLFVSDAARLGRDAVHERLARVGVQTKRYFHPPVHLQTVFRRFPMRVSGALPATVRAASEGLALPLYSHMTDGDFERVCREVERLLA